MNRFSMYYPPAKRIVMFACCTVLMAASAFCKAEDNKPDADSVSSWKAWENLSDQEAWKLLPKLAAGEQVPLPNWVKPIALQMPRTAAAMIELDYAFRTAGPLDPALRSSLRWIIAHANHSPYGEALAVADLRSVAGEKIDIARLQGGPATWPSDSAKEFEFVRLLTIAAPTIPDSLFEQLRQKHGDRGVAAMVLLTAYSNFQDRFLLGLQVPVEPQGPYPPLRVKFAEGALQMSPLTPTENGVATYIDNGIAVTPPDKKWALLNYEQLQTRLESQRDRKPRLPVPTWDEVKEKLPSAMAVRPTSIRWSLVNYGYAADLAIPWALTTRTHWAEYPSNRILEESLFWVQTRALECNYCMGHCEMLLEVAGLDSDAIAKRTRMLADTDWAMFPPDEQRAYAYARKLTSSPADLNEADYRGLEKDFGPKRAMSIFFWLCRGLYMTRISDGFQLPLERDNVFGGSSPTKKDASPKEPEDVLSAESLAIVDSMRSQLAKDSEALAMLEDILDGSNLGPEDGWFPLAKPEVRFDWSYVTKKYDTNSDDNISEEEFPGDEEDFARLDRNDDGSITEADFDWNKHSLTPTPGFILFFRADRDANGRVTKEEFANVFDQLAEGGDYLAIDDLRDQFNPSNSRSNTKRPDSPSKDTLVKALQRQELGSLEAGPRLNEQAPDFTLTSLTGEEVQLSKVTRSKPTVLIFGNFTCGPFRSQSGNIEKLYLRYRDRANFLLVYVREAHPSDGWWMQSNQRAGIDLSQPKETSQRRTVAETCQKHLELSIPFLVDSVEDRVGTTYSGMPNRLYLIDTEGKIAFKNGRGPFGFHPRQLEQSLVLLLNDAKDQEAR